MKRLLNKIKFVFGKKIYCVYSSHYLLGVQVIGLFSDKKEVDKIQKYFTINSDSICKAVEIKEFNKLLVRLENV